MDSKMRLAKNNWVCSVEISVQDPTELVHSNQPRTKAVLRVVLSRGFNDIMNDTSKPLSELLDDAILWMTLDRTIWSEFKGKREEFIEYNCANCGAGLSLRSCTGCGHRFRDNGFRCGWNTPLSPRMVAFLRDSGHEFKIDPEIARTKERENWGRRQQTN